MTEEARECLMNGKVNGKELVDRIAKRISKRDLLQLYIAAESLDLTLFEALADKVREAFPEKTIVL